MPLVLLIGACISRQASPGELSVARTAIAHAGGVDFRRLTPAESQGPTPVRRPRAVIVTDDGLGFAVAKCDVVDGHNGIPSEGGWILIAAWRSK